MAPRDYGQYCGLTRALELVGERWALLIVRDLLVGPRRYGELQAGLPRIPSNVLATRLKELQEAGIVRRIPRIRQIVYELTPYGRELDDVVLALGRFGFKAMGDPRDEQIVTPDSMTIAFRSAFRPEVAAQLPPTHYAAILGQARLMLDVRGPGLEIARLDEVARDRADADLVFETGLDIRRLISGELSSTAAVENGTVRIEHGDLRLLERFARTFHLAA